MTKHFSLYSLLIALMLFASPPASAQGKWLDTTFTSVDVFIGQNTFLENFYGQLNTTSHFRIGEPVMTAGFGMTGDFPISIGKGRYEHFRGIFYHHVIPQRILVDSTRAKLTGFIFGVWPWGIDLLPKRINSDIMVCAGFNTGRLKIFGDEIINAKNQFFTPKISVMPKVRLGRLVLGLCTEFGYDISFAKWRKMRYADAPAPALDKFRQSGIACYFSLGYVI